VPASSRCSPAAVTTSCGLDADEAAISRGRGHIEKSTGRAVSRGKLTEEERAEILGRIRFTESLDDLADRDLVVEAVPEQLELKRAIFEQLDKIVKPTRSSHQHLEPVGHRDLRGHPAPARRSWACTSSTPRRCRSSSRS
jgi:hypothetical protein